MSQSLAVKAEIAHSVSCAELKGSSIVRAETRMKLFMVNEVAGDGFCGQ